MAVTRSQVERAAYALHKYDGGTRDEWRHRDRSFKAYYRAMARAALLAATRRSA